MTYLSVDIRWLITTQTCSGSAFTLTLPCIISIACVANKTLETCISEQLLFCEAERHVRVLKTEDVRSEALRDVREMCSQTLGNFVHG